MYTASAFDPAIYVIYAKEPILSLFFHGDMCLFFHFSSNADLSMKTLELKTPAAL
jgi:hypothetical protein